MVLPLGIVKVRKIRQNLQSFNTDFWGTWVARSVKRQTLGFSSGHDLMVHEFESHIGLCTDSLEPAWDSVSFCLYLSPAGVLSLSLSE